MPSYFVKHSWIFSFSKLQIEPNSLFLNVHSYLVSLNASENLLKLCCPKVTKGLEEGVILSWHPVMAAHNFPSVKSKWYRIYHNKDQKGVVKKVLKVDKRHIVLLIKSNSEANMFGEPLFQCSDSYLEKSILGLNLDWMSYGQKINTDELHIDCFCFLGPKSQMSQNVSFWDSIATHHSSTSMWPIKTCTQTF